MTIQDMFDRAVRGLRSQGFTICTDDSGCVYTSFDGTRHCAWGWVDPTVPYGTRGTVRTLRDFKIGLAADLDDLGLQFALSLQRAHDRPAQMETALRVLGAMYGLTWPEGA